MAYTPTYGTPGPLSGWADGPGGGTPETAAALDNMEQGIVDAHAALATLPTTYALVQPVKIYAGPTQPNPPPGAGEYLWFDTDGNGGLLDIQSGVS
jgi:hypothetical protein